MTRSQRKNNRSAAGQAEKLVRLAINAHLAVIAVQPHFLISSAKGMSV